MSQTPYLNLNKPDKGALDWDAPLNYNFDVIDQAFKDLGITKVYIDVEENMPPSGELTELYIATDTSKAYRGTGDGWMPFKVDWMDILNKPSVFPPAYHTHVVGDIEGLDQWLQNWLNTHGYGSGTGGQTCTVAANCPHNCSSIDCCSNLVYDANCDCVNYADDGQGGCSNYSTQTEAPSFSNDGGGTWPNKYIKIGIEAAPSDWASYLINLDGDNLSVYNYENTLKIGPNPVLADTASNFWNEVKDNGYDVRFTDQHGNELNFFYPPVMFDKTNRKAHFIVKVPAGTTEIRMYWGNANAGVSGYLQASQVAEWVHTFEMDDEGWVYETGGVGGDGAFSNTTHSEGRSSDRALLGSYSYKTYHYMWSGGGDWSWRRWKASDIAKSVIAYVNFYASGATIDYVKLILGDGSVEADLSKTNTWQMLKIYNASATQPKLETKFSSTHTGAFHGASLTAYLDMVMSLKAADVANFNAVEFIDNT